MLHPIIEQSTIDIQREAVKEEKRLRDNQPYVPRFYEYIKRNLLNINLKRKLKIAWDPGNGAMGTVMKEISEKLTNSENIIINDVVATLLGRNGCVPSSVHLCSTCRS